MNFKNISNINNTKEDKEEDLKILSTTVEALNQQLKNGYKGEDSTIDNKLDNITNMISILYKDLIKKITYIYKDNLVKYKNLDNEVVMLKEIINHDKDDIINNSNSQMIELIEKLEKLNLDKISLSIDEIRSTSVNKQEEIMTMLTHSIDTMTKMLDIIKESKTNKSEKEQ
jgi:hypothetical protein